MKEIIEKAILVRSVCNDLYTTGILDVKASDGIQCDRKLFLKIVGNIDNFELKKRSSLDIPYETIISVHGTDFFAIWSEEELLEAFPNIDINNVGTVQLQVQ